MFVKRVLGIDPGVATTGFGVVEQESSSIVAVASGAILTPAKEPLPSRLAMLAVGLRKVITEHEPESIAVERILFQNNVRTAMAVGQASGVVLLCAAEAGLEVGFYSPNEIKQAVTGSGLARKDQVSQMVQRLFGLDEIPRPDDVADALAIAFTHLTSARLRARISRASGDMPVARLGGASPFARVG